jgi:hypothetical protein
MWTTTAATATVAPRAVRSSSSRMSLFANDAKLIQRQKQSSASTQMVKCRSRAAALYRSPSHTGYSASSVSFRTPFTPHLSSHDIYHTKWDTMNTPARTKPMLGSLLETTLTAGRSSNENSQTQIPWRKYTSQDRYRWHVPFMVQEVCTSNGATVLYSPQVARTRICVAVAMLVLMGLLFRISVMVYHIYYLNLYKKEHEYSIVSTCPQCVRVTL